MNTKRWFLSKTLWVNILGVAVIVINHLALNGVIDPSYEALGLAIINIILRAVTKQGITK